MTRRRGVIVTGGGSGIGRATAQAFAARGDDVLVVGRTRSALTETAADHPSIRVADIDITDDSGPAAIADAAKTQLDSVDVLVNNAAVGGFGQLGELDRAQLEQQLDTNLLAPVLVTQALLEPLAEASGVIVNIGSAGALGLRSWPGNAVYGATKAGLDLLTRSWAVELSPRGIRVVGLAPGIVETDAGIRAGMPASAYAAFLDHMRKVIPTGRTAEPEEIAWWIVQLSSDDAYVNGTTVAVDGALSVT
ncbi:SDR family NAD(P)-dependent oxidoreductase [Nocardia asteroides]